MSRLYDVGDQPASGGSGLAARMGDERRRIVPIQFILIALGVALVVGWQVDRSGLLQQKKDYEGTVTSPDFAACADTSSDDCVINGNSFIYKGAHIRIADVDVARMTGSSCADEADRGKRAADRLRSLLNAGAFEIRAYPPFTDDSGDKLSSVVRQGQSISGTLVSEGLARNWDQPTPWCNSKV